MLWAFDLNDEYHFKPKLRTASAPSQWSPSPSSPTPGCWYPPRTSAAPTPRPPGTESCRGYAPPFRSPAGSKASILASQSPHRTAAAPQPRWPTGISCFLADTQSEPCQSNRNIEFSWKEIFWGCSLARFSRNRRQRKSIPDCRIQLGIFFWIFWKKSRIKIWLFSLYPH